MDRMTFLKSACSLGVCGCVSRFLGPLESLRAEETAQPDRRLAFARFQIAKMAGLMAKGGNAVACAAILQETGRECAKLGQLVQFKGNPEGYFAAARDTWGTDFTWDKQRGTITVAVAEGECSCPMVDSRRTPAFFCNCSIGYQKEAFETVFGKPVKVVLKESKLGGSKRCIFEVTLV